MLPVQRNWQQGVREMSGQGLRGSSGQHRRLSALSRRSLGRKLEVRGLECVISVFGAVFSKETRKQSVEHCADAVPKAGSVQFDLEVRDVGA